MIFVKFNVSFYFFQGVGKSSLLLQFTDNVFEPNMETTIGVEFGVCYFLLFVGLFIAYFLASGQSDEHQWCEDKAADLGYSMVCLKLLFYIILISIKHI